jgi:hypothetical protein
LIEAQWNTAMSKVQISVEWGFKEITQVWTFLDFCRNIKIFKFPVAKYYVVAAFLCNICNCFYSIQMATYYGCSLKNDTKISLNQYLSLVSDWEEEEAMAAEKSACMTKSKKQ